MSVRQRLDDALFLWNNGRKEGAWIQVLIAAAATSRMRFPKKKEGEAFRAFIREVKPTILDANARAVPGGIGIEFYNRFRGDGVALDRLIYTHMRCDLVHEAVLPEEVQICESRLIDGKLVAELHGVGTKTLPLTIPDFWVLNLAKAIAEAPENAADCAGLFDAAKNRRE
jgi:hypothetical protein